jgi:hypothetical protein
MYGSENLWPEKIASPDPSAPKIILEKQARYFNAMMKNTIIARVLTSIDGTGGSSKPKRTVYDFLKKLQFPLFLYHILPNRQN